MSQLLDILPLTKSAFAPFGDVIEADPATMRYINNGTTERFHALAVAEAVGEGARVIINLFRGQPRVFPYEIGLMERHPFGSQSFSPISGCPYLVVAAEDEDGRPGRPLVFLARGNQGVNYRRNVWHHPLMSLNAVSDFLVVDREGPGDNLEEYFFETPYIISEPSL
ncbi:ureidoglycolate hydrolase [Rhizobium sp. R72]|uniref:ureidoglycolate lyase n=1 Tax=unclassified Rhizobium TaxID=2613769 RepID=UPI000B5307ED|nr:MULTISPECIES: ureidoglycolate lyase [unclassified Rhizobium]OWV93146.1 ureidoglycolate hydrolase [Rhizobium sp. R72]OWV93373.1 ureidoglycolate hydrolase [Rhizobium sp. R711]OWV99507.1 ureidoglycolate hydrolase [Rhizobium sp. R693]